MIRKNRGCISGRSLQSGLPFIILSRQILQPAGGMRFFPIHDYGVEGEDGLGRLSEYAMEAAGKTERKLSEISWDQYEKAIFLEKAWEPLSEWKWKIG